MNNSQEKFAIYRDYEGYDDLESKIHKGDTLKVYFRHSNSPYNLHVFQLEKNREVLETFSDYKESSSTKVGLAFFLGILTLIYSVLLYNKMTVVDLLTFFVEGKKK